MKTWQERFKSKVLWLDDSDDSCLIWVGALRDDGRGRFFFSSNKPGGPWREVKAHRVAWELFNGRPVPKGVRLIQECNHPQCVRHWRLDRPSKKLSVDQVHAIRYSGRPAAALAVTFGVSVSYVKRIKCGAERASVNRTDGTGHTETGRACA